MRLHAAYHPRQEAARLAEDVLPHRILSLDDTPSVRPVRQAVRIMAHEHHSGRTVVLSSERDPDAAAILAMAYLIHHVGLTLDHAYERLAAAVPGIAPTRRWLSALVEAYDLPYCRDELYGPYFLAGLRSRAQDSINEVYPGLFVSGIGAMQRQAEVRSMGIRAIVRLDDSTRDDNQWAADFTLLDMPLSDYRAPNPGKVRRATAFIHAHRSEGVLVHCQMGINRAVTVALAYLMEYQGYSLGRAQALITRQRGAVHPTPEMLDLLQACYCP